MGISVNRLALALRVPVTRVADIVHGRRAITPDTALRLGRCLNTTPRFWLNLQTTYDLQTVEDSLLSTVARDVEALNSVVPTNGSARRNKFTREVF
jgi:addiction module HigA family antidote